MPTGNFLDKLILGSSTTSSNATSRVVAASGGFTAAQAVMMKTTGQITKANSSSLSLGVIHAGIAVTAGTPGSQATFITHGPVDTSILNLGAGIVCAVGTDANGNPVRVTDAACVSGLKYLGVCDSTGTVYVSPSSNVVADPRDYGAVGNGTTDDTAAIQAAISSGAARISFPALSFAITALSVPATGIVLEGAGKTTILLVSGGGTGLTLDATSGGGNTVWRDFTIQNVTGQTPARAALIKNAYHVTLHNVKVLSLDGGGFTTAGVEVTSSGSDNSAAVSFETCEIYQCKGNGLLVSGSGAQNFGIVVDHACEIHANQDGGIVSTQTPWAKITIESGAIVEGNTNHQVRGNYGGGSLIAGYFELPGSGDSGNSLLAIDTFQGVAIRGALCTRGGYGGSHPYHITIGAAPAIACDGITIEDNYFSSATTATVHVVSGDNVRYSKQRNNGAPTDIVIDPTTTDVVWDNSPYSAGTGPVKPATTDATLDYTDDAIIAQGSADTTFTLPDVRQWGRGGKQFRFKNHNTSGAVIIKKDSHSTGVDGVTSAFVRCYGDAVTLVSCYDTGGLTWSWNILSPATRWTDPRELTSCVWFLDAAVGVTQSGNRVSGWADQSDAADANENAAQATGAKQPLWKPYDGFFNGQATITDDDGARYMATGNWSNPISAQPLSIVLVGQCTNSVIVNGTTDPYIDNNAFWRISAGTQLSGASVPANSKCIVTAVFNGGSSKLLVNSSVTTDATGAAGADANFGGAGVGLLADTSGAGKSAGDKLAFVAAFADDVTADAKYTRLIASLAARYGVVLI